MPLKERVELAIESVRTRDVPITAPFWAQFHAILGLGPGLTLYDAQTKTRVNAFDYMAEGKFPLGPIRGLKFVPTDRGLDVQIGPEHEGQGHIDQFAAEMVQWGIPRHESSTCSAKSTRCATSRLSRKLGASWILS